ncbi:MAG TPA: adenosine deaminase [Terracidiphilus sp.]|jgi:adenosine deaminase|nr:adenosine deaminase [Terracidiphilus sp.]
MPALSPFIARLSLVCTIVSGAIGCNRGPAQYRPTQAEERAALIYQANLYQGPEALRGFLADFPKGADLHVHLSGAVYAETYIRDAAEDGLCVDTIALALAPPPCRARQIPAKELSGNISGSGQALYDKLVDSFSMRSYVPVSEWSGHDQFFSTFGKWSGLNKSHIGEWIDEVASRAAAENQQYLELMETPPFSHAAQIGHAIGWSPQLAQAAPGAFAQLRQQLLDHGLRDEVAADREDVRQAEAKRRDLEYCGTAQATVACGVEIRYIYQVLREYAPERVYAQTLLGFETVQASMDAHDDTWVGINFVMPEDGFISMRDYTLQMKMLDYLHSVYPRVHITLHAGELTEGLVPPEGLRFHIRQAVELGHAERIGHGVDVMYEDHSRQLLQELAQKHIMIEINLSSNQGILGVAGDRHPFPVYRAAHVPVALSTDDEGVSRIDLTHEYVRAARDYGLTYLDLKQMARTGMEHDFLPGVSLWAQPDDFRTPVKACAGQALGAEKPSQDCSTFLDGSQKAAAQWELERRFAAFEAKFQGPAFDRMLREK